MSLCVRLLVLDWLVQRHDGGVAHVSTPGPAVQRYVTRAVKPFFDDDDRELTYELGFVCYGLQLPWARVST